MSLYSEYKNERVDVNYETGYHFVLIYLSEHELSWTALSKRAEGAPETEKEPYDSYDLGDGRYMVNWIEESGLVVSQILSFKEGKVWAFMTWPDEKERGKRAKLLHKGTLTVLSK